MSKRDTYLDLLVTELKKDKDLADVPTVQLRLMSDAALDAHVKDILTDAEAVNTLKLLSCLLDILKLKILQ